MNYNFHINYQYKNSNNFNHDYDKVLHSNITASVLFLVEGRVCIGRIHYKTRIKKGINYSHISLKVHFHVICNKFSLQKKKKIKADSEFTENQRIEVNSRSTLYYFALCS